MNGAEGAAATAAIAARPPTSPKVSATSASTGRPTKRAASGSDAIACSARPCRVRSNAQAASAASPAARPITKNDRICTLAPAIVTIPSCRPGLEVERVREDVRRTGEHRTDHPAQGERDRERRGDPAEGRAAQQIGLDEEHVRGRSHSDAQEEPDRERDEESAEPEARLAHRPGARGHEQRREDRERDQVAEREVDDTRQPVDQRIADREETVDPPAARPVTITWTTMLTARTLLRHADSDRGPQGSGFHRRSEIDRATKCSRHPLGRGNFMRRRFGLVTAAAVAVAGAVAIVSIGLAVAGSSHNAPTARATIGLAGPSGGASAASITHSQAMPRVQVAHGVLTPAVRDMPRMSGHWNKAFNKVAEHSRSDGVRMPDKHEGSALVQHGAKRNAMPTPIGQLRRRRKRQRSLSARHRGRHRPEPLHAVGQPRVPDLQPRRHSCEQHHAGLPALHRPVGVREPERKRR